MNFPWMPSLKHLALVKVTTELWNLSDVRDLMARGDSELYWHEVVEDKVMEKVQELPLPKRLKNFIFHSVRPIGLEIYEWQRYLCEKRPPGILLSAEEYATLSYVPCWTPQGSVDQKTTAQALVQDDNVDITQRYILACNFCFEDDIKELWNSLPQTDKVAFYDEEHLSPLIWQYPLTVLWTYDIKGELVKLNALFTDDNEREISAYRYAFKRAAMASNKTATDYFLQKLNPLEREESFAWYTEYITSRKDYVRRSLKSNVLFFLLSQMTEEQQVRLLEGDPRGVLLSLLHWPWQSFFIEAANRTWDFLSEQDYALILCIIVSKIRSGFEDCDYNNLFGKFWEQGPSECKKYFIDSCYSDGFELSVLFDFEDKENIGLILRDADVKQKEEIIFHFEGNYVNWHTLSPKQWDLLEFMVEECLASKDVIIQFKNECERHITYTSMERSQAEKCTKFFQFLDDLISKNCKKRDMEEGNGSPSKRLK